MLAIAPYPESGTTLHDLAWLPLFFGATFTMAFLLKFDYHKVRGQLNNLWLSLRTRKGCVRGFNGKIMRNAESLTMRRAKLFRVK
jgi:hypothetical protein